MKEIGRREFLKYSSGVLGLALVGGVAKTVMAKGSEIAKEPAPPRKEKNPGRLFDGSGTSPIEGAKFGMVIDVGACIGCRRCMYACKTENNISDTISPLWIEVFEMKSGIGEVSEEDLKNGATTSYTESPKEGSWYMPTACNHCDNPPCVKVCPTGATWKDKDGYVLMDYSRCIGCRLCVVACPYSARRFNWFKPELSQGTGSSLVPVRPMGVVEKCTFCVHRTRRGQLPRCVEICPVQARHFGNLNDPNSSVSRILKESLSFRLLEEQGTEPNIRYITRGKKWLG